MYESLRCQGLATEVSHRQLQATNQHLAEERAIGRRCPTAIGPGARPGTATMGSRVQTSRLIDANIQSELHALESVPCGGSARAGISGRDSTISCA